VLAEYNLDFDFQLAENLTLITRADLILYVLPVESPYGYLSTETKQILDIKAVVSNNGLMMNVVTQEIDPYTEGFKIFNVLPAVMEWVGEGVRGKVIFKVTVQCVGSLNCATQKDAPPPVKFKGHSGHEKAPRLLLRSKSPLEFHNRRKRQNGGRTFNTTGVSFCQPEASACCLKNLTIDVEKDLQFEDFIVEPKSFEANYCNGICPIYNSEKLLTPELYQFLGYLQGGPASAIKPCCGGNTFKSVSILMYLPHLRPQYQVEILNQVTVTSCRCT
jgi:hypothetical protein